MLDSGLAHFVNELAALPGGRWISACVLQSGNQPDAHDLDLAALKHKGKVANGLLDLGRRWLALLFARGCGIRLDLSYQERQDNGLEYPGRPGNGSPHQPASLRSARGEPPDPPREPRRVIRSMPLGHFPVKQATVGLVTHGRRTLANCQVTVKSGSRVFFPNLDQLRSAPHASSGLVRSPEVDSSLFARQSPTFVTCCKECVAPFIPGGSIHPLGIKVRGPYSRVGAAVLRTLNSRKRIDERKEIPSGSASHCCR